MAAPLPTPKTFIFKTVNGVEIPTDVYAPPESSKSGAPILVFFHGGGLLSGSKVMCPPHLRRAAERYNLCVVAPDYRLAPQVGLPDILEDVRDSIKWSLETLPGLLPASKLDTSRLAVVGGSAGGYLALLSALPISGVVPKPKVLAVLYPITNPLGPFFTTPQRPVNYFADGHIFTEEELAEHLDPKSKVITEFWQLPPPGQAAPHASRQNLYSYMVQEANLAHLLFVSAPGAKVEDYIPADLITKDFPPTYVVHGPTDFISGVEQSRSLVEALKKAGVPYEYEEREGAPHGFDANPSVELEEVYEFIFKYL